MDISQLINNRRYPLLWQFVKYQVDMQFADLRCLLQLPKSDLNAGCNFAAAAVLFNIIAGFSVCFYNASLEGLKSRKERGDRFKGLLRKYYPWANEPVGKDTGVKVLYKAARNPLAHSLGVYEPRAEWRVMLGKDALTASQIETMENSKSRPVWLPPTVSKTELAFQIYIPTLYWGRTLLGATPAKRDKAGRERREIPYGAKYRVMTS